jgi:hypothetical protein
VVFFLSRDSSVGIASAYGMETRRPGFNYRHGEEVILRSAQGPVHPPFSWVPEILFPRIKRPGRETDHSAPSSAEVKNGGVIPPLLHMSSCSGT